METGTIINFVNKLGAGPRPKHRQRMNVSHGGCDSNLSLPPLEFNFLRPSLGTKP